ncbi:odorant receptor 67a-like [Sitophilus oryzae]|uniref:Odorant receptor 67a-like n=1 Tax=Sitophilus oryzae TaxID=7048 RepID=A0A6J2YJ82_SITOR|nr:odorant receptor 67a-like [Sitophilus oryzae]
MAQAILLLTPCLFSTKLTKKSENISTAAYTSDWLNGSTSFKKMLVLIILRSQKPMRFYAANFFELSLTTFVAILKASYSYFALMNKMSNKNQG